MNYLSTQDVSKIWNMPEKKITRLCREGRVEGAKKQGKVWLIPSTSNIPIDGRKLNETLKPYNVKLPLPIGESDYKNVVENYYYVDKTLLIKDLLDKLPKVSLFTRPRRFGKTLTMSMIKTFFEISDEDNSKYFKNKKIYNCGTKYKEELGKYPVFFITFKDIKKTNWESAFKAIRRTIALEFQNFSHILESNICTNFEKNYFKELIDCKISEDELQDVFIYISKILSKYYNKQVIIIIDEYDTPTLEGYSLGYYDEVIRFMRNLLSGAFKDNSYLKFGFLTGILQIAKESIFSGLNNLSVHSILEDNFSQYFGFTHDEVKQLLKYYNAQDKYDEITSWYDGYSFGNIKIFNPWSVINYFYNNYTLKPYWVATGENSIIKHLLKSSSSEIQNNLRKLLNHESITAYIENTLVYNQIDNNHNAIYNFLLSTGYLKIIDSDNTSMLKQLAIPNKEIRLVYEQEILILTSNYLSLSRALLIQKSILNLDLESFEKAISDLLLNTISAFDYSQEGFYQGLTLGLCAILNDNYKIESNIESGFGRCDISLTPYDNTLSGIIIEVKAIKEEYKNIESKLNISANEALKQINDKKYYLKMKNNNIKRICKIGLAYNKRIVKLVSEIEI